MKAYLIDAGEINCTVEYVYGVGERREVVPVLSVVYAQSAGRAKKLFIDFHKSDYSYTQCRLEWTDKMSIRVLAHERDMKWRESVDGVYLGDWNQTGTLTHYGKEVLQRMLPHEMRGYVTVSPEAKQELMEIYDLPEDDFIAAAQL